MDDSQTAQKVAELPSVAEQRKYSVQDRAEKRPPGGIWQGINFRLTWPLIDPEGIPDWPSDARDAELRNFWPQIPLLAATIISFVSRIKTLPIIIEADDEEDLVYWKWVLGTSDFGKGLSYTLGRFVLDLITQGNGGFIEVIRPTRGRHRTKGILPVRRTGLNSFGFVDGDKLFKVGKKALETLQDDPYDTPIGIAHLDASRCVRQQDPQKPVKYCGVSGERYLNRYQVFDASWIAWPDEEMAGYGMDPITLCQISARITKNIDIYVDEKVGGRFFKRIIWGSNVFQQALEDAVKEAETLADARGLSRYVTNVVVGAADLATPGEIGVLDLAGLPDNFDRETEYDIAADLITACFGIDRPEVIPMRTATLGQAGQVGIMAQKARGKGIAEVIRLIERFLTMWVLPLDGSVRVKLDYKDDVEDMRTAELQKTNAETIRIMAESPTADLVPPYTSSEVRALHEHYGLIPETMLTEEEEAETPAKETEGEEGKKAMVSHVPETVLMECPLCSHDEVDRYADHGGLCVCRGCKCTFDPQVEHAIA